MEYHSQCEQCMGLGETDDGEPCPCTWAHTDRAVRRKERPVPVAGTAKLTEEGNQTIRLYQEHGKHLTRDQWNLVEAIRGGLSVSAAASLTGNHRMDHYNWRRVNDHYRICSEMAKSMYESGMVSLVNSAAVKDAKHAQWMLSKINPEVYGDKKHIEFSAKKNAQTELLEALSLKLDSELYAKVLDAVLELSNEDEDAG